MPGVHYSSLLLHRDTRYRAILGVRLLLGLENGKLGCTNLKVEDNTYAGLFLTAAMLVVLCDELGIGTCDRLDIVVVVVVLLVVMNVLLSLVTVVVVVLERVEEVDVTADADADADVVDDVNDEVDVDTDADSEVEVELVGVARGVPVVVPFLCVYGEDAPAALVQVLPEHF